MTKSTDTKAPLRTRFKSPTRGWEPLAVQIYSSVAPEEAAVFQEAPNV